MIIEDYDLQKIDLDTEQPISHFLKNCPTSTIFHTLEWNRLLSSVFNTKSEKYRAMIAIENGQIVGFFPYMLNRRFPPIRNLYSPPSKYETPYGGPLCLDDNIFTKFLIYY